MTVSAENLKELESQALELLRAELDPEATGPLHLVKFFEEHPFNQPAGAALFSWSSGDQRFFLIVGNVIPMIYPDLDFPVDNLWAVHVGNEYFIKNGVEEETERDPKRLFGYLKMVSDLFYQQLQIRPTGEPPKIDKIYRLEDRRQVVGTWTHNQVTYSWIVGDVPHYIFKRRLPPQITWALHIGTLLLS